MDECRRVRERRMVEGQTSLGNTGLNKTELSLFQNLTLTGHLIFMSVFCSLKWDECHYLILIKFL